jgi:hypothetical protein
LSESVARAVGSGRSFSLGFLIEKQSYNRRAEGR